MFNCKSCCMFVIRCDFVKHIVCFFKSVAFSLSELYVRQIHNSSNSQLSWCFCICFRFSTEISCLTSLLDMRLVRNRVLVMKYSYEYNENFILIINNKIDWFFRFDVFETIYHEKICIEKCQNRIWSIYSFWFWCI